MQQVAMELQVQHRSSRARFTDPVSFAHDVLGLETYPKQEAILRAVAEDKRVAVRSGHKTGKSTSASILALWWPIAHENGRVILTATTNPQIRNVLWKEIRRLRHRAKIPYPEMAELPALGMQWPNGREIIGFSTKESERMAGLSGSEMLFIVDEASGVPEVIYEAIEGNRAGGAHVLIIGNPTQPAGTFFDAFHSKTRFWKTIHVSSLEAAEHAERIPGLARADFCAEKLEEWGATDPRYHVRVLGNFADQSEQSVVSLYHLEKAQERFEDPTEREHGSGLLCLGVDPAKFGDDETVISVVRGRRLLEQKVYRQIDENEVAKKVGESIAHHLAAGEQNALVKVDSIGVGVGVMSALSVYQSQHGDEPRGRFDLYAVDVSEASDFEEEHHNKRAQLWFGLADWIKDGGQISRDDKLESDCLSAHYDFDNKNRLRVEKKDEIKKRLGRSPDRADSLALAVYFPQPRLCIVPGETFAAASGYAAPAYGYRMSGGGRGY